MSQFVVFLLMFDALIVAIGQRKKKNMWTYIVLYWMLLTWKNAIDFMHH